MTPKSVLKFWLLACGKAGDILEQTGCQKRTCQRIVIGTLAQIIFKDEVIFCQLGRLRFVMSWPFFPLSLLSLHFQDSVPTSKQLWIMYPLCLLFYFFKNQLWWALARWLILLEHSPIHQTRLQVRLSIRAHIQIAGSITETSGSIQEATNLINVSHIGVSPTPSPSPSPS